MKTIDRRGFIRLCGCAACGAVLVLAGCSNDQASAGAAASGTVSETSATGAVACPRGVTWDPYPGRCHSYRDSDGDGYCDWSVPA